MAVRTFGISGKTDSAEDYRITASGLLVPASALNPRTGVLSAPVLTGTGSFTCTVSPCTVAIDGTSNSLQAGYVVTNDLTTTVTIAAASVAARTDLICLQVLDNTYDGSGQSKGQITYVQGTSGGGIPATPANSIVLWQVPVGASAGSVNFASATAVFPYTGANGSIVAVRNAADKPAVANGVQYRHRLDVAAGGTASPLEWSTDGTTYNSVIPSLPWQQIKQWVFTSSQGGQATAIPSGFSAVMCVWTTRGGVATASDNIAVTLNGDTTAIYDYQGSEAVGSTASGITGTAQTRMRLGRFPAATEGANLFGCGSFILLNPSDTVNYKAIHGSYFKPSTTGAMYSGTYGGIWRSSAAVTVVTVSSDQGSTLLAGTVLTFYGLL